MRHFVYGHWHFEKGTPQKAIKWEKVRQLKSRLIEMMRILAVLRHRQKFLFCKNVLLNGKNDFPFDYMRL